MFLKVLMHRIQVNGFDWFLDAVVGIVSRAANIFWAYQPPLK
jgi:hypothetical protein